MPVDCRNVCGGNGVYTIYPNTSKPEGFDAYCYFDSDGIGWTVN